MVSYMVNWLKILVFKLLKCNNVKISCFNFANMIIYNLQIFNGSKHDWGTPFET
jgi:hypothetical protein